MRISVTVVPNAKVASVAKTGNASYKVKVNARAVEGRANERLVEILADYFSLPKSCVTIVGGLKGRSKTVDITPR
ncbi:putative ACR, YggU family [uncultured archaeon]|nr:putative ACR, YggU family [uncultured archaeon]